MKKQNLILLIILVTLGAAYFFISNDDTNTPRIERRDFTVKNADEIDKIIITSKTPKQVILDKNKDGWVVNQKYKASKYQIKTLLKTVRKMEIKHPTSKQILNKVYNELTTQGIKVELFGKNKEIKTFYVGGNTFDERGTYMMIEGALTPYAIHIPGFEGYLRSRFIDDELMWRDLEVMDYNPDEIKSVSMEYYDKSESNFTLTNNDGTYTLTNNKGERVEVDQQKADKYFGVFEHVALEAYVKSTDPIGSAEILTLPKVFNLTITTTDNKTLNLRSFQKEDVTKSEDGSQFLSYLDKERLYGTDGESFFVIQFFVFNPILKQVTDFK